MNESKPHPSPVYYDPNNVAHDIRDFDNIPAELRALTQWVVWKLELRRGKLTKVPYTATGSMADSTGPQTWATFESCRDALRSNEFFGLGFVFADGGELTGTDLDKHRDAVTGELDSFAAEYVSRLNSYAESSQSGTGVHIIARATLPDGKGRRDAKAGVEMYSKGRFFVMTGKHIAGTPRTVEPRHQAVAGMFREIFAPKEKPPVNKPAPAPALTLTDHDLISKASNAKNGAQFSALWRGDFAAAGYGSQSEADAAFLSMLYFWTGGDKDRSFSLFSQSGLNRDKWQREDYRESTWQLVAHGETYSAEARKPQAAQPVTVASSTIPKTGDLSEFEFANLLADKLPPIKTVGSEWFAYSNGAWQKIQRATLRPIAQEILPPDIRTARREATLLDHLEGRCQVEPDSFRGFYRADGTGAILINVENGIVRVTADEPPELLPHDAGNLFTLRTAAKFDPQADANLFKNTLGELLPDELDRDLLQLCFGNFLLPDCRFEVALVCYGEANCGKSTIAEPVAAAMGAELVARLAMSQICDTKSYHLHKLQFAAVNLGTELDVIAIDESANFKLIVSGEPVEARPIYGKPLTMETSCKLWFLANGLPRFKNGTEAELRRTRFIRFDRRPAVNDVTLKDKLKGERDGVFNFMLAGLQRLLTVREIPLGGSESQSVHARFKVSNDPLGTFVAQQCQLAPDAREPKAALQSAFNQFCETHGLPVELGDWFFKRLYERFTNLKEIRPAIAGERVRCVAGIKLKTMLETD